MGTSTDKMGNDFTEGVIKDSMRLAGRVGRKGISEDPQPAFNWIEEEEVWPEGGDKSVEREEAVEMEDTLMDMFIGDLLLRGR